MVILDLVRRRKAAGITQVEIAAALHTDQSKISKFERLERDLGLVDFVRYCRALRVKPADILQLIDRA